VPDTFEHFVAERYVLYAASRQGALVRGRVHHRPYPLHQAELIALDESLLAAAAIPHASAPVSVLYSPGVDVEVFPLERVG
jgi:uncharacterized protein YqjF (DUF2071 family)